MATLDDHKILLRKPFVLKCVPDALSSEYIAILEKYGYWLEALALGSLSPITDKQRDFIAMHMGMRPPETSYEHAWRNYQEARFLLIAKEAEQKLPLGAGITYGAVVELYKAAAALGNKEAIDWLLVEEQERPQILNAAPLDLPRIKLQEVNHIGGPRLGQWVSPATQDSSSDWSDAKDDYDNAYWEDYLGGPDDSKIE